MDPRDLEEEFIAFAASTGVDLQEAPPATGLSCMLRFYAHERAEGCDLNEDADMLLFQWGIFDCGAGPMFEIDLTRQVILPDEVDDDAIWQLHLTYRYKPTSEFAGIAEGNQWCHSPAELKAFEEFVLSSPAVLTATGVGANEVDVTFECAG